MTAIDSTETDRKERQVEKQTRGEKQPERKSTRAFRTRKRVGVLRVWIHRLSDESARQMTN